MWFVADNHNHRYHICDPMPADEALCGKINNEQKCKIRSNLFSKNQSMLKNKV